MMVGWGSSLSYYSTSGLQAGRYAELKRTGLAKL